MSGAYDPRRVRVLHVIDTLNLGGAQTALLAMCRVLSRETFDVRVAVLHGPGVFDEAFQRIGCAPVYLAHSKFAPHIPFALRALLREWPADIVHAHLVPSCFLCEMLRGPLHISRLICHLHTPYRKNLGNGYQNVLERVMYRRCDLVLACSDDVRASVVGKVRKQTLHNAVDTERFRPLEQNERRAIRRELGYGDDDIVIGMTGRMIPSKDHDVACRAVAALRADVPNLRLLFVGSGPHELAVRRLVQQLGVEDRTTFAGYRDDVERYLGAIDVFVMATRVEGFGLSLIEAMSCGVACAVSDYRAAREIVTPGEDALSFPGGDVAALTTTLRALATDPALRQRLGTAARKKANDTFGLGILNECLGRIYGDVLSGRRLLDETT